MNQFINDAFADMQNDLSYAMKGLKNITITHEKMCGRCDGSGKVFPKIKMRHAPINAEVDNDFMPDMEVDESKKITCTRCKGSGGIETVITVNVTREPVKEKKK